MTRSKARLVAGMRSQAERLFEYEYRVRWKKTRLLEVAMAGVGDINWIGLDPIRRT